MLRLVAAALVALFAVPAAAANTWSAPTCQPGSPCKLSFDTVGQTGQIQTPCGKVSMLGSKTGEVHPYKCTDATFANCVRAREFNESGVAVDVTIDSTTADHTGQEGQLWIFDVVSGSGTVLVGCSQ